MKVSYKWLETYFPQGFIQKNILRRGLPSPKKLEALFNNHAFEVEGLEKVLVGKNSSDVIFDIKVLPDKAHYALSHRGIAKEAGVISGAQIINSVDQGVSVSKDIPSPKVRIEDSKLCPRYMLRAVRNVTVAKSPEWLSGRLEAVGARSINNIVDATNFVMLDIGQPLHAFDAEKVVGTVTVRLAIDGEKITILDGRELELLNTDLVIADEKGPIAIAGVKGGKRAEVTTETKKLLIESANFNPTTVRKTSTRLNLRNDSSKRFENEITPALAAEAMDAVTKMIVDLSGGVAGAVADIYPSPVKPWAIQTNVAYISSIVGKDLSLDEVKNILEKEGCVVETGVDGAGEISVTPPLDRLDIKIPEDIADEISRIIGYDKLPSVQTPQIDTVPADNIFYLGEKIKDILVSNGFSEVYTYSLVPKGVFEISYPLASDKSALRESITPKLSESLTMNGRNADLLGLETIKIFEVGSIFPKSGEKISLAIGTLQVKKKKGITSESLLKDAVALLESELKVKIEAQITGAVTGAVAEIDLNALVSQIQNSAVSASSISFKDINFQPLSESIKYVPFSHYPFIVRDIALFVPSGTPKDYVMTALRGSLATSAGNLLVKGPDMFDMFEKDGRVSYAFRMIFQSFERTLSDEEVNGLMEKVYSAVKAKGWEVR